MTIKQQGGIFGRNPTFNDVTVDNDISVTGSITADSATIAGSETSFQSRVVISPRDNWNRSLTIKTDEMEFSAPSGFGANYNAKIQFTPSVLKFYTGDGTSVSEAAKFDGSGNLVFPSGQGIDFSATSGTGTSELFSDYEEGNWTPAIEIYGTPGTYTATTSGIYTKVGNLVTVTGRLINVTESVAGGADYFKITGLPFTDIAGYSAVGSVSLGNWNVPACYNAFVTFDSTGARDYVIMGLNVDNGATDYLDKTHLVSGTSDIEFTISYFT